MEQDVGRAFIARTRSWARPGDEGMGDKEFHPQKPKILLQPQEALPRTTGRGKTLCLRRIFCSWFPHKTTGAR